MKKELPTLIPGCRPRTGAQARMPQKMPMRMTQPRSTPSMVATSTGPGVGGMKAWPTARPASRGDAVYSMYAPFMGLTAC